MTGFERPRLAYVGSYTSRDRNARGEGISIYGLEPESGEWSLRETVPAENPTFLCFDATKRYLYSCQADGDCVSAYAIDQATGGLRLLNTQRAGGKNGVHILPDPGNRFIIVVSKVVDVFPLAPDGSLRPACATLLPEGELGPLKEAVDYCPHQGVFSPDGNYLLVPDKFLDGIHILRFDPESGTLQYHGPKWARARPGAGPRHLAWHPSKPLFYSVDENDNTVTVWSWDAQTGAPTPLQWVSAIPPTYFNKVKGGRYYGSGEIWVSPSGRFVYASNRGHDSIVSYAVDAASGCLNLLGWENSRGKTPRYFCLTPEGTRLYAANLYSDTIAEFRVDGNTGALRHTGRCIPTANPCCILFL